MTTWKFELGAKVGVIDGRERGVVIGRAEYAYAERSYQVRYANSKGDTVETWITESALEPRD